MGADDRYGEIGSGRALGVSVFVPLMQEFEGSAASAWAETTLLLRQAQGFAVLAFWGRSGCGWRVAVGTMVIRRSVAVPVTAGPSGEGAGGSCHNEDRPWALR